MSETLQLRAAVRPTPKPPWQFGENPLWGAGNKSAHVVVDELTHLLTDGRAKTGADGVA